MNICNFIKKMNILSKLENFVTKTFKTTLDVFLDAIKMSPNAQGYVNGSITELLLKQHLEKFNFEAKRIKEKWEGEKHSNHKGDLYFKKNGTNNWYVLESKGVKSVRARVTNILKELPEKITVDDFSDNLFQKMQDSYPDMTEYQLSPDELRKIEQSANEQFGTWDWTYGKAPEYTISRDVRYPAGKITTYANVENSIIKSIKIYGDFFGIRDVDDIEMLLIGEPYDYNAVLEKLATIDISQYFSRMTTEEVAKAIVA